MENRTLLENNELKHFVCEDLKRISQKQSGDQSLSKALELFKKLFHTEVQKPTS